MSDRVTFPEVAQLKNELENKRTLLEQRREKLQALRNGLVLVGIDLAAITMFVNLARVDRLIVRERSLRLMIAAGEKAVSELARELVEVGAEYEKKRKKLDEAMPPKG